jgi:RNA polymerase sigma-70 factor (ECF subfamily)
VEARSVPDDAELMRRIAAGDEPAFRQLADRHARYLYGIAHSLTGNPSDAEDVVQETLVAVLGSKFRGESAVRTWMVQILVRRAGMLRRKKRPGGAWPADPAATRESDRLAGTEARLDLAVMLETLSPEHRQVIVLREVEQMSYDEMAAALGIPRGTVESRLHRARAELRERFKGYL